MTSASGYRSWKVRSSASVRSLPLRTATLLARVQGTEEEERRQQVVCKRTCIMAARASNPYCGQHCLQSGQPLCPHSLRLHAPACRVPT